jgi:hypothetical protein
VKGDSTGDGETKKKPAPRKKAAAKT